MSYKILKYTFPDGRIEFAQSIAKGDLWQVQYQIEFADRDSGQMVQFNPGDCFMIFDVGWVDNGRRYQLGREEYMKQAVLDVICGEKRYYWCNEIPDKDAAYENMLDMLYETSILKYKSSG